MEELLKIINVQEVEGSWNVELEDENIIMVPKQQENRHYMQVKDWVDKNA